MTIGRVLAHGRDRGSGFVIATGPGRSSRVVLTAAHVVGGSGAASLEFRIGDRTVAVERAESDEDLDVAVLHLVEEVDGFVAARARERLAWQVDARPRANDARLTGIVSDTERPFSKERGPDIHVLQLLVDQVLGDYEGYSGSPVVLGASDSRPVLGVLIEQLRWRTRNGPGRGKDPAGNVLYAVSAPSASPVSPTSPPPPATAPATPADHWPYSASPNGFAGPWGATAVRSIRRSATRRHRRAPATAGRLAVR
jgi:hypothetical protein